MRSFVAILVFALLLVGAGLELRAASIDSREAMATGSVTMGGEVTGPSSAAVIGDTITVSDWTLQGVTTTNTVSAANDGYVDLKAPHGLRFPGGNGISSIQRIPGFIGFDSTRQLFHFYNEHNRLGSNTVPGYVSLQLAAGQTSDSNTVTDQTVQTEFTTATFQRILNGAQLATGSTFLVCYGGIFSVGVNASQSLDVTLYINSTAIMSARAAVARVGAGLANYPFYVQAIVTTRTTGAAATVTANGIVAVGTVDNPAATGFDQGNFFATFQTTTVNVSGLSTFKVFGSTDVNTASTESVTLKQFMVVQLN